MLMVYVNAMGGKFRFLVLMSWFLLVELCRVGATVWLSYWTGITDRPGRPCLPAPCIPSPSSSPCPRLSSFAHVLPHLSVFFVLHVAVNMWLCQQTGTEDMPRPSCFFCLCPCAHHSILARHMISACSGSQCDLVLELVLYALLEVWLNIAKLPQTDRAGHNCGFAASCRSCCQSLGSSIVIMPPSLQS